MLLYIFSVIISSVFPVTSSTCVAVLRSHHTMALLPCLSLGPSAAEHVGTKKLHVKYRDGIYLQWHNTSLTWSSISTKLSSVSLRDRDIIQHDMTQTRAEAGVYSVVQMRALPLQRDTVPRCQQRWQQLAWMLMKLKLAGGVCSTQQICVSTVDPRLVHPDCTNGELACLLYWLNDVLICCVVSRACLVAQTANL